MKMSVIQINKSIVLLLILVISSSCAHFFPPVKPKTFLTGKDIGVAVLSPDNQTVVFSLDSILYNHDLLRAKIIALDNGSLHNYDPAFSPDGSKIVFCHSENQGDICVINIDGSGRVCLTSGVEHDFEPVYSQDGSKIYFLRAKVFRKYSPIAMPAWHEIDVYSINADGSGLKRITFNEHYRISSLSINPEGDTLMVQGFEGNEEISPIWMFSINDPRNKVAINPDLTTYLKKKFLLGPEKINYTELSNPRFSTDGTHMLFAWPNRRGLYIMDLKTNSTKKIWTWEGDDESQIGGMYPRFSQDGQQVIFSTSKFCKKCDTRLPWPRREPELWIIKADGTGLMPIEIK